MTSVRYRTSTELAGRAWSEVSRYQRAAFPADTLDLALVRACPVLADFWVLALRRQ